MTSLIDNVIFLKLRIRVRVMDAVYDDKTRIGSSATDDVIDVITDDFISQEKY